LRPIVPLARSRRKPADAVAADHRTRVRNLVVGNVEYRTIGRAYLGKGLAPRCGSADLDRGRRRLRAHRHHVAAVAKQFRKRRGARRLNDGDARQPIDESERARFAKTFAERARIPEVSAGKHEPVRYAPVTRLEKRECGALLAFDTIRIHAVDDRDAGGVEPAHDLERAVEISVDRRDGRAVVERLRHLRLADSDGGNEHECRDFRARGIRRHRGGGVAGTRTDRDARADFFRVRDCDRHARVLERRGRIHSEMQVRGSCGVRVVATAYGRVQRKRVFAERHDVRCSDRWKQLAKTPHAARVERLVRRTTVAKRLP
jgi:hypothetical protein